MAGNALTRLMQFVRRHCSPRNWTTQPGRAVFAYNPHNRDTWIAELAEDTPAGSQVLDVGAGRAPYRGLFAHCAYRTHDFGQEPGTIGHYAPLDFESDILEIPVADATFDVVLCTEVLEHVPQPILAVRELSRLLRPGGRLLLTAPLGSLLHQEPYHFYGGYTPHWYQRFLTEAGLEVNCIERNRGFFSLFAQEGIRFSAYLDPRRTLSHPLYWPLLTLLWAASLPVLRLLFPLLAPALDRLNLETVSTAGYHVVATKRRCALPRAAA